MHMYLLEQSYSTRTITMKRTNFSRRFDKPDLNFQKVYTQPNLRSYSKILTHVRTALAAFFNTPRTLPSTKNDSQTAQSHLISQNFSLNLFLSTCQRKNCKKITDAVASMDQNQYPLSKPIFFSSMVGCERR